MSNELIVIENLSPIDVFAKEGGADPIIKKIKERARSEVIDISTPEGRRHVGSLAKKIGSAKVTLEKMALGLTEDWRKQTAAVNAEKKRMADELDALRDEIKAPLDEFKQREQARIDKHEQRLEAIKNAANFEGFTAPDSQQIKDAIEVIKKLHLLASDTEQYDWEEFSARASDVYKTTNDRLKVMLVEREKYEAEQAELERLRREEEDRKAQAERDRIASEAAEKARKEAEEKAAAEKAEAEARAEAAEKARIDAEIKSKAEAQAAAEKAEADKQAAIKAERERLEAEKKADEEAAAKREADIQHKAKINREARDDIMLALGDGYSEDAATKIVTAIALNNVRNIKIFY